MGSWVLPEGGWEEEEDFEDRSYPEEKVVVIAC